MPSTRTMTACTCSFDNACKYSGAERMSARSKSRRWRNSVAVFLLRNSRIKLHLQQWNRLNRATRATRFLNLNLISVSRAELSNRDVEASSVSLERLPPAMRVEVGSDNSSRRMIMLRKTAIALLAVASVGLAAPTMALARGGGGGGHGGGGGGMGGGHGGGFGGQGRRA